MNHRAPTLRTAWFRRALRGLTILLLPAWLPDTGHPTVLTRRRSASPQPEVIYAVPYVRAIGSPALRFREAAVPPPDLPARPVAGGPPQPKDHVTNTPPAAASAEPAPIAAATDKPPVESTPAKTAAPATPPATILPDETRPKVREEDFLPFFQFPTHGDVTVLAPVPPAPPAPGHPPPSSATYRQQ